jgi:DNA polymerase-1
MTARMKTLLLIDANSLIHRAYHALPPLTASDGSPAGALYGVARMLGKIMREDRPEYMAACFDRPEPTFRKQEYKEYKAQRPETDKELISQLVGAHELFAVMGIRVFDQPGLEADDCIATLARRFGGGPDPRTVILTGDRDTLQLVRGDSVVVRAPKKGISDTIIYNEDKVREEYGLAPAQMIDYKALAGDASDNIKGVPGVGPKTAKALLSKYLSVEDILAHPEDPAVARVIGQREAALQSKRLVILRDDAPLKADSLEDLAVQEDDLAREVYFLKLGFKSLSVNGENGGNGDSKAKPGAPVSPQGIMF